MSQIFLFTGENEHELRKERRRWIQEFEAKHGSENLVVTDGKNLSLSLFMDEICAAPFIAEKRLVVVDGLPKFEKGQFEKIIAGIHPQVLLLFTEAKPDKRLSFTKEVLKLATVKTFSPLRGSALKTWLMNQAQADGATLGNQEATFLMEIVGENQALLANEVAKLATACLPGAITKAHIERMVILSVEQAGWKLMDLLAAQNTSAALKFAHTLQKRGESPYALWNMFLWIVSQLSLVTAAVEDGITNPAAIAKQCGVSPMTARNLSGLAKNIGAKKMADIVQSVTDADIALKTGGHRATVEAPEELAALIDSSIAAVATA